MGVEAGAPPEAGGFQISGFQPPSQKLWRAEDFKGEWPIENGK